MDCSMRVLAGFVSAMRGGGGGSLMVEGLGSALPCCNGFMLM